MFLEAIGNHHATDTKVRIGWNWMDVELGMRTRPGSAFKAPARDPHSHSHIDMVPVIVSLFDNHFADFHNTCFCAVLRSTRQLLLIMLSGWMQVAK